MSNPPTLTKVEQLREYHRQWEISHKLNLAAPSLENKRKAEAWESEFRALARELADQ